jgi:hypothetical protein
MLNLILILGMSATATMKEQNMAKKLGMHIFFPKPVQTAAIDTILLKKKSSCEKGSFLDVEQWVSQILCQQNY